VTTCAEFAAAIDDAAIGASPSSALARHVATCADCAAQLERRRILARRIDGALGSYFGTEPPPGLAERIIARASPQRPRPAIRALALASALIVVALLGGWRTARQSHDIVALTAWRSPTASLLMSRDSVLGTPLYQRRSK